VVVGAIVPDGGWNDVAPPTVVSYGWGQPPKQVLQNFKVVVYFQKIEKIYKIKNSNYLVERFFILYIFYKFLKIHVPLKFQNYTDIIIQNGDTLATTVSRR
jgi:hypothetical protein